MEVHGSYGYRDNNGIYHEVHYVADKNGFKATVKSNEPSLQGTKEPANIKLEPYQSTSHHHSRKYIKLVYPFTSNHRLDSNRIITNMAHNQIYSS